MTEDGDSLSSPEPMTSFLLYGLYSISSAQGNLKQIFIGIIVSSQNSADCTAMHIDHLYGILWSHTVITEADGGCQNRLGRKLFKAIKRVAKENDGASVIESTLQNSPILIIEMSFLSLCLLLLYMIFPRGCDRKGGNEEQSEQPREMMN